MNKKIKVLSLFLIAGLLTACGSSSKKEQLFLLNVGDYLNPDLVENFEREYNVKVVLSEVESNEAMYEQLKLNRTSYDIAFPSDYMIEQMDQDGLIQDIDFSKLKNYNPDDYNKFAIEYAPKSTKYVPYFNGTIGLMYNTSNIKDIDKIIKENGFNVLFDSSLLKGAKIGMYNSSRDAFAVALIQLGYDINTTDENQLNEASKLLSQVKYDIYGDDNLKKSVVTGNLDVALVYSGDFFDEYGIALDEGNDTNFAYYVPETTNYWLDGMVISKNAQNTELAHKFIDFIIEKDNAVENSLYIGFASPQLSVIDELALDSENDYMIKNPYFDPSTIKGLKPESYHFISLDYMSKLEEMFAKTKVK